MSVILRLKREGAKKKPFYHIVAADSRSPRDGKSLEIVGTYDPRRESHCVTIDRVQFEKWIQRGAQMSDTVRSLLSKLNN
ncbi:MAG: 30S ribosomal protein S16 [Nitrospinae bacterium]|nr:30S ribosomal protein S16 [Nitrospinota bacterium]